MCYTLFDNTYNIYNNCTLSLHVSIIVPYSYFTLSIFEILYSYLITKGKKKETFYALHFISKYFHSQ